MGIEYEDPDMEEFLSGVAKRFCPNCGRPVTSNRVGRPRVYCSDLCRKQFWQNHPRADEWNSYETLVCPVCDRVFRAKRVSTRKRKYCSKDCAAKGRWQKGEIYDTD